MEASRGRIVQVQQNEVDLMDLLKILYKNRVMVAMITAVVILASLGGALYVRSNTNNLTAINFKKGNLIDNFYIEKANLGVEDLEVESLFKQNDVVEEMYELNDLNKLFLESGAEDNLNERRDFLEDTIKLRTVVENKELKHYQLSIEQLEGNLDEKKILDTYLNILNKKLYTAYDSRMSEKYEVIKGKKEGYEETLIAIEDEIKKVISQESRELFENERAWDIIQVKHLRLFERQEKIQELYTKYADELVGINGIKEDSDLSNQVIKISSFYEIKQKSKAKLILAIGIVMGVILGVMSAFIREFWKCFKKDIEGNN